MTHDCAPIPAAFAELINRLDDEALLFYVYSHEGEPGFRFLSPASVEAFTGASLEACLEDPERVFGAVSAPFRGVLRTMLTTPAGGALVEEPLMLEWSPGGRAPFWADHQGVRCSETLTCGFFKDRDREMAVLKDLAQELKESRAGTKSAIESIPGPALLVSSQGTVTAANRPGALRFGPHALGQTLGEILGEPTALRLLERSAAAAGPEEPVELECEHRGRALRLRVYPVTDERGALAALSLCADDITELKSIQEETCRANRLESLRVLAGGIAHGFNNTLGIMVSYAEIARARAKGLQDPEFVRLLDEILGAGVRGRDLVRQATVFTASRHHPDKGEPIEPTLIVSGILRELRPRLPRGIALSRRIESHTGLTEAGPEAVHQIASALIAMGLSAMQYSGGELFVLVEPEVATLHGVAATPVVVIEVRDTGPLNAPRRFDVEAAATLKALGGALVLEPGEPFRARALLPRYRPAPETHAGACGAKVKRRLLVVDDNESVLAATVRMIELLGLSATGVSEIPQAMALITAEPFDLVLTDYAMPTMSGLELVSRLRAIRPIPAILYTGHGELLEDRSAEGVEVLAKPLLAHELWAVLERVLGRETL